MLMGIRKSSYTPKSGKPGWVCDYRDAAGKRHQESFPTRAAAQARYVEVQEQIRAGTHVASSDSPTVARAAELFLTAIEQDGAAPSTLAGHRLAYNNQIAPLLAGRRLSAITPATVQAFLDDLSAAGRSDDTVSRAKKTLGAIIDEAIRTGRAAHNPVRALRARRRIRRRDIEARSSTRAVCPEREDVRALIEGADASKAWPTGGGPVRAAPWLQPWLACIALAGLRPGEARGLTWGAVNLEAGWIEVRTAADAWGNLGPVKTAAALRRVPIGDILLGMLRDWRGVCPANAAGLVFASSGSRVKPGRVPVLSLTNIIRNQFDPLQRRLRLVGEDGEPRYTPHKLRHFAVSLWIDEGADVKQISQWVGHESAAFTLDVYGHLFQARALDRTTASAGERSVFGLIGARQEAVR